MTDNDYYRLFAYLALAWLTTALVVTSIQHL